MTQEWRTRETDPLKRIVAELGELRRAMRSITNNILTNAGLVISTGLLRVLQSMRVEGNLDVTGTTALGGPTTITGTADVDGTLNVNDGGFLRVRYPDSLGGGTAVFFGRLVSSSTGDYQGTGLLLEGQGSTENILVARTNVDGSAHTVQVYDNEQNSVVGVFSATPRGLSHPTFAIPVQSTYWQTWGSTDSSSWTTIAEGYSNLWHGGIWSACRATTSESGTTGDLRMTLYHPVTDTEHVIGSAATVGFTIAWQYFEGTVPSTLQISDSFYIRLQARRTGGAGRVHGVVIGANMRRGS